MELTLEQRQLIADNAEYIRRFIRSRFPGSRRHWEDLEQEGIAAVCRRVPDYDPNRASFSTFACSVAWGAAWHLFDRKLSGQSSMEQLDEEVAEWKGDYSEFVGTRKMDKPHRATKVGDPLTRRERQVLRYLADGMQDKEIAEKLGVAVRTAQYFVQQISVKFGVDSRWMAVRRGLALGLCEVRPLVI